MGMIREVSGSEDLRSSPRCPNCGFTNPNYSQIGSRFVCGHCHAWTVNRGAQLANVQALYGEDYFEGAEYRHYELAKNSRNANFKRKWEILAQFVHSTTGDSVEVGSATGDFLALLGRERYGRALGIEVSAYARGIARDVGVVSYDPRELVHGMVPDGAFCPDLLVGWDVWEHLENPVEYFETLLQQFPSVRFIAITTVDSASWVARLRKERWRQFHPPTHLNYPTKESFQLWADGLGFEVVYSRYFGYRRPLFEYLGAMGIDTTLGANVNILINLFDTRYVILRRT